MVGSSVFKILPLEKSDTNRLNLFLKYHGTHHYQMDRLFCWEKADEYISDIIFSFSLQSPVWVAVEGNNIKGLIGFRKKEWDTDHFGYPVASIDYFFVEKNIRGYIAASLLASKFNEWVKENAIRFISIKTFPNSSIIKVLEENRFYYVGTEFTLSKLLPDPNLNETLSTNIRLLKANDIGDLLKILKSVSWLGRFHSDFNIDKEKANQLYISWLSNGIKKGNTEVTVLEINHKPSGFILWSMERLFHSEKTLVVGDQELAAVDPAIRGRGYGKILYRGALMQMQKAGINLVKTNIAANNAPALNNQASMGFGFNYSTAIFHKFVN